MKNTDFILILLGLLIIYLIYKTRNLDKSINNFSMVDTFETTIDEIIDTNYKFNIDAIRNFASITNNILNETFDNFILPSNSTYFNNVTINGLAHIKGPLNINNTIEILNRNKNKFNIFPRNMIVFWPNNNIPSGWALCDGSLYKLDKETGDSVKILPEDADETALLTPNLSGKFILGAGNSVVDANGLVLTDRILDTTGGEEEHKLTVDEMPSHKHYTFVYWDDYKHRGDNSETHFKDRGKGSFTKESSKTGSDVPHNNMPPFYVLNFIIKL